MAQPAQEHEDGHDGDARAHGTSGIRRAVEEAMDTASSAVETARRLAPAAGKAAAEAVRDPEALVKRARRLGTAAPIVRDAVAPLLTRRVEDWHAEYAYSTGLQAFIYGFPYIFYAELRHDWVTQPRDPGTIPYAAVNHFWHQPHLTDATLREGGSPNNDTLYSLAWVDLSEEPVLLSHPDLGKRYFTFQLVSFTSDTFAYVGQRTTGSAAGHYALIGPDWHGELPEDVQAVDPSPTPWILILGRTLVAGADDVPAVRALQRQYRLTPLGLWGQSAARVPVRRKVYAPNDPDSDPLAPWKTLNAMLAENPPPAHHKLLLDQFARIGIGPGLDVEAQPESVKRGLMRAAVVGVPLLRAHFLSGDWATIVNGWQYPPSSFGRLGDDYLYRAADQCLAGIAANDPAEAIYLVSLDDADGARLSPQGRYTLRFEPTGLPPVDVFWSLSAYTAGDMNLIPNTADRYSVGDRTAARDADGGVTIYLQPDSPGADRESNWLPTSAEHEWYAVLRLYRPREQVVGGTWRAPGLVRTG